MSGKDSNYQVVYRGQVLPPAHVKEGGWVFFQRLKECGGGYWLGKTWQNYFEFGIEAPVSLAQGIEYLIMADCVESCHMEFVDDFKLE